MQEHLPEITSRRHVPLLGVFCHSHQQLNDVSVVLILLVILLNTTTSYKSSHLRTLSYWAKYGTSISITRVYAPSGTRIRRVWWTCGDQADDKNGEDQTDFCKFQALISDDSSPDTSTIIGRLWPLRRRSFNECTSLARCQPEIKEEMQYHAASLAKCRYVCTKYATHSQWELIPDSCDGPSEFLQERLTEETEERTKNEFVPLPFRYAEIAKVLLDV